MDGAAFDFVAGFGLVRSTTCAPPFAVNFCPARAVGTTAGNFVGLDPLVPPEFPFAKEGDDDASLLMPCGVAGVFIPAADRDCGPAAALTSLDF